MDYERLPIVLKRYSFIEKMRVLQYYSRQIMNINGIELTNGKPSAWELETFLLFAIKADEYNNNDFKGKNINKFIEMINCIKEHQHPNLLDKIGTINFADFLLIALGSTQFDIQTYNIYKYYRYNYFFTYISDTINMKEEFYKKFGINYDSFLELGSTLSIFCSLKVNLEPQILRYIVFKYAKATNYLILSREIFQKEIDKFSDNIHDYLFCVRPSYVYPFIEYKGMANLPLPHCVTRAITDSLLYRLTDSNSELRTLFGKNVLEDYLFDIINKSTLFDEVLKEQSYKKKHNTLKTSDVMCRNDNNYIFFESKATVPYAKTRCLDEKLINQEIDKISEDVIQLYKQVYFDFKNVYNFFEYDVEIAFDRENCFGIVVLLEESYIRRELIYTNVAKKLNIDTSGNLYNWIIHHIKICNLYDIERYVFSDTNILKSLKEQIKSNRPYDYPLSNSKTKSTIKNDNVYSFKKNISNNIKRITDELIDAGLLKKN